MTVINQQTLLRRVSLSGFAITPSEDPLPSPTTGGIKVGGEGEITVTMYAGGELTFTVAAGEHLAVCVTHVTASTADGLVGLI